jgi:hypothetical protein
VEWGRSRVEVNEGIFKATRRAEADGGGPCAVQAIVIVPGFASHLELEWEDRARRSFIRRLATFATVMRYDKRGRRPPV